jgi:hypothetical protein
MVVTAPFGRYPQPVLTDSRLAQPVVANRAERRNGNRKRRVPLALLLVPIALVAAGVVLVIVVAGGGGGGILGDGNEDEAAPPFDFRVGRVTVERVVADADTDALQTEAEALVAEITPVLDEMWTDAFLDPANWREGEYEEFFAFFAEDAAGTARSNVDVLTLGASAGDEFTRVAPDRGGIDYTVLFDRENNPDTVSARVRFYATAELRDGTFVAIVSAGQLFLQDLDGWKVVAFDVRRNDHETTPPTPAPTGASPNATGSPAATGATG